MSRIAITGSSGLVGSALRRRLAADGHDLLRVRRGNPSDPAALWNPAEGWVRDGALEGVDAVVHLAGASIGEGRWSAQRKQLLVSSRVDATRLLVDHLGTLAQRPRVLISASGIGYYGSQGDRVLTEDAPRGEGFLAGLVEAWEAEVRRAEALGIRAVMLRFGLVLSNEGGALKRLLLPFRLGLGGRIGSGRQYMAAVALDDVTRAIAHALASDLSGPANVTIPEPVTNAEFTKALARVLGRPAFLPVPPLALKAMLGGEAAEELLLFSQRAIPAKLEASGYRFRAPTIQAALRSALGK